MNKLTQKRNAAFKAAKKAERAVMVAKDALSMLNRGKTTAECGVWVLIPTAIVEEGEEGEGWAEVQICDLTDDKKFNDCQVCALGSLMLSEIRHTNKLTVEEAVSCYDEISYMDHGSRLDKIFSFEQQRLMEIAFEGGSGYFNFDEDDFNGQEEKIEAFYQKYPEDEDRLRAILKNIIKNNGKFVL